MNPRIDQLQPYPFERLRKLFAGVSPPLDREPIALSIGEPRHPAPAFVLEALAAHLGELSAYPATRGQPELRAACCRWAETRFGLNPGSLNPESHLLPCNGTREALFSLAQALIDTTRSTRPLVICPNPFYQIYEGAALLAGAEPLFLPCRPEQGFLPDFASVTEAQWRDCQLLYLCSPGNPTGAVLNLERMQDLLKKAHRYDFVIAADECYAEIYPDEKSPPPGLLEAAFRMGLEGFDRALVFHSLSKRSNLPGLRSGFVAGDASLIARYLKYRTYQGCAMAPPSQHASIAAWQDEAHVRDNRALYRQKFREVMGILGQPMNLTYPDAGFYLWAPVGGDDQQFARALYATENVSVLPGSFLARESPSPKGAEGNPGSGRVRMALVAEPEACVEAATRIRRFLHSWNAGP